MHAAQILEQFEKLRQEQGEGAFRKAQGSLIENFLHKPNGDTFLKNVFPELDTEALKAKTPAPPSPETLMLTAIQQQMPSIKTQAHFDVFMLAFDALKQTLDAAFQADEPAVLRGKTALDKALQAARQVPALAAKLQEIPADQRSKEASASIEPPKQFQEADTLNRLLQELAVIKDREELSAWYATSRAQMDRIASQPLRNKLYDAIRARRVVLESGQ